MHFRYHDKLCRRLVFDSQFPFLSLSCRSITLLNLAYVFSENVNQVHNLFIYFESIK